MTKYFILNSEGLIDSVSNSLLKLHIKFPQENIYETKEVVNSIYPSKIKYCLRWRNW